MAEPENIITSVPILPGQDGKCQSCPDLLTEQELIQYLRIPELSKAKDHHNVIENLKRMRGLPTLHICNRTLYPLKAVRDWVDEQTRGGK